MIDAILLTAALGLSSPAAPPDFDCGTVEAASDWLGTYYGETLSFVGRDFEGSFMALFVSDHMKSYTIVSGPSADRVCLISIGETLWRNSRPATPQGVAQ